MEAQQVFLAQVGTLASFIEEPPQGTITIKFLIKESIKIVGSERPEHLVIKLHLENQKVREAILGGAPTLVFQRRAEKETSRDSNDPYTVLPLVNTLSLAENELIDRHRNTRLRADEIIALAREWSHSKITGVFDIELPPADPESFDLRYDFAWLRVPAEESRQSFLIEKAKSSDLRERLYGISNLHLYPNEETRNLLIEALADPTTRESTYGGDRLVGFRYPVREAAITCLAKLPKTSLLIRAASEEEKAAYRRKHWDLTGRNIVSDYPGWEFVSSEDGDSTPGKRGSDERRYVQVLRFKSPEGACHLTLVPRGNTLNYPVPDQELLGTTHDLYCYVSPGFPEAGKDRIKGFFGIQPHLPVR
jgi:hypothetical protein